MAMTEEFLKADINNSFAFVQNISDFLSEDPFYLQSSPYFSKSTEIILAISISLMVSVTVIGNGLVILAFFLEKKIRTPSNYFLLNLAICDFFVGVVSIPVYTPYVLSGKWTLGTVLCKVWLITDSILCLTSEFSIVLISYDRFLSIIQAVEYQIQQRGARRVLIKMSAVWVISFFISSPFLIFGEYLFGTEFIPQGQCYLPVLSWSLDITISVCTFTLPFVCTTYFSIKIYWNLRKRSRQKHRLFNTIGVHLSHYGKQNGTRNDGTANSLKLSKDKKIAQSLAIIVSVYGICWAPFNILTICRTFDKSKVIDPFLYDISSWMLWFNSCINPVLYPFCHSSFKRAILKILCLKRN
ncbi:histamine H3 receptor-like [Protopterus annectens]|uniref:histamine H3 receptor-like n=1 Tax=Protopterus annectens TaxID=7888 RepID=UPI001CF99946|nr:histamine H3 receptor-like [Protopterus annectens]